MHLNSADLESGNDAKGLSEGVGDGDGDWRVELSTTLDIEPLAYIRTADGFVTSMHDLVVERGSRHHHVPIFNPGSNRSQVSRLRIINPSDTDARVEIYGLDDEGERSGDVDLTVPAGGARTVSAPELGSGGRGLSGRLGDGAGKWHLFVSADRAIQLANLLRSPTGHLANLSTSTDAHRFGEAGTKLSAGEYHTCMVRDTGAVACWGSDIDGQATPPAGSFVSVSAGLLYTCGLRDTGAVTCWGLDDYGQSTPPADTFVSVSAGGLHACGLRDTGAVACWGSDSHGQSTPPAGTFVSVSAGRLHTCGLRDTGAVACWGDDQHGQSTPPPAGDTVDLVVQSLAASPGSLNPGQRFTLSATVRNQGTARSAATTLRYYRSTDATISASDTAVGTDEVRALSASGTSIESISLTAPSSAGTYYYGACVDSVSGESDTGNNCSSAVRVTVGGGGGTRYGAIASDFNPERCSGWAAGIAVDHGSAQEALDAAVRACQDDGGSASDRRAGADSFRGCAAMSYGGTEFNCGAIVVSASNRFTAESTALGTCRAFGFSECRIWTNNSGQRISARNSQGNGNADTEASPPPKVLMKLKQRIP